MQLKRLVVAIPVMDLNSNSNKKQENISYVVSLQASVYIPVSWHSLGIRYDVIESNNVSITGHRYSGSSPINFNVGSTMFDG